MQKDITVAVVRDDEAISFPDVEPLNRSGNLENINGDFVRQCFECAGLPCGFNPHSLLSRLWSASLS